MMKLAALVRFCLGEPRSMTQYRTIPLLLKSQLFGMVSARAEAAAWWAGESLHRRPGLKYSVQPSRDCWLAGLHIELLYLNSLREKP